MKDKFSYKNDYDKYLIDDYINVVTQLVNAFPKTSPQKYDFYENNKLDEIGFFEQIEKDIKSLDDNQHEIIRIVGQAVAR